MITLRETAIAAGAALLATVATLQLTPTARAQTASQATSSGQTGPAAATTAPDMTLMKSAIFQWDALKPTATNVGEVRRVIRAPTATLDEFESHITTLNAGVASHAPHTHANEEVIIHKEGGALEAYVNGEWRPVSPHSMIFMASNSPHAVRNVGQTAATYYVINWASPGTLKKTAETKP